MVPACRIPVIINHGLFWAKSSEIFSGLYRRPYGVYRIVKESGKVHLSQASLLTGYSKNFVRLLYAILLVQSFVIAILFGSLSNEYLSNAYMQAWVDRNAPILGVFLHGEVDALIIGISVGFTVLLVQRRIGEGEIDKETRPPMPPQTTMPSSTDPLVSQASQPDSAPDPPRPARRRRMVKKQTDDVGGGLDERNPEIP